MRRAWHRVTFTFPPDTKDDHELLLWAESHGFKVVDWALWERDDGARLEVDPCPPPPPHGFEVGPPDDPSVGMVCPQCDKHSTLGRWGDITQSPMTCPECGHTHYRVEES